MLSEPERLKKSSEFHAIYNLRKSVANSLFILYVGRKKKSPEIPAKVGFIVGKKVSKKATKRNYIKRLLREVYKNIKKTGAAPLDDWESLIFTARPASLEVNYQQVYDAVVDCLRRARKKYGNQGN